jgi:two-component system response regulator GlrR
LLETPLVGRSPAHRKLLAQLERIAPTDAEVLISGPTGVGKELYARYTHRCSRRAQHAFVAMNCGAIPSDLFENELFGHVGGAFTGARLNRAGLVDEAEHGTLLLDEVDALSLPCQVKLLRLLQEREYRRLGESRTRRADVRVIAASNADLFAAMREGRLREDLFFRLCVCPVEVPALRDRPEDIAPLLEQFTARYAIAYGLPQITFTAEALTRLDTYAWPGNVRELENCVRRLTCLQLSRAVQPDELRLFQHRADVRERNAGRDDDGADAAEGNGRMDRPLQEAKRVLVNNFERRYLGEALRAANGNIARAARRSGKARRAFFELMKKYRLSASDFIDVGARPSSANGNGSRRDATDTFDGRGVAEHSESSIGQSWDP